MGRTEKSAPIFLSAEPFLGFPLNQSRMRFDFHVFALEVGKIG